MVGLGEKLGMNLWIGQPSSLPFFSGVVALSIAVDDGAKGCYMWTTCDTYGLGSYVGYMWTEHVKRVAYWSDCPLRGVHRFESPRLSDMSNRLFVTVIT
jgi:hypothetical protein